MVSICSYIFTLKDETLNIMECGGQNLLEYSLVLTGIKKTHWCYSGKYF